MPVLVANRNRRLPALPRLADAQAVAFSLKTFAAGMLALSTAMAIGMDHPVWSLTTAYIVSQPFAGGVVGKAIYRLAGTLISAAVAVVLVPNLVNAPELLSLALALWLGVCSFVATLNRSPSSYIFLMSGYTVSIIAFPALDAPGTIFTVASFRVQEIAIGILAGALVHGAVFPRTVSGHLLDRARAIVRDAERWSAAAVAGAGAIERQGRHRLALDLNELRQLVASLPFDTARFMPRPATVQALRDQLTQLLPLATTVEDRRDRYAELDAVPSEVRTLLADVGAWLRDPSAPDGQAATLAARAAALEPAIGAVPDARALLALSLLARLADLLAAHRNCRLLLRQVAEPDRVFRASAVPLVRVGRFRALHRDVRAAALTAIAAVAITLVACAFWIATAWDEGAEAVLFAGVAVALFGSQDQPQRRMVTFLVGMTLGALAGVGLAFAVLPRVTDPVMLAVVLFPAFFVAGVGIADPRRSQRSLGFTLGIINSMGLDLRYAGGFAELVNATLALLLGVAFACFTIGLVIRDDPQAAVRRLIRAGWRDLARRSDAPGRGRVPEWVSRMLDRVGLLLPRLETAADETGGPLLAILTDMRTGVNVGHLRDLRADQPAVAPLVTPVLQGVGAHYARRDPAAPAVPPPALLAAIDRAVAGLDQDLPPPARRAGLLALTGLRRNLFPLAAPFGAAAVAR